MAFYPIFDRSSFLRMAYEDAAEEDQVTPASNKSVASPGAEERDFYLQTINHKQDQIRELEQQLVSAQEELYASDRRWFVATIALQRLKSSLEQVIDDIDAVQDVYHHHRNNFPTNALEVARKNAESYCECLENHPPRYAHEVKYKRQAWAEPPELARVSTSSHYMFWCHRKPQGSFSYAFTVKI